MRSIRLRTRNYMTDGGILFPLPKTFQDEEGRFRWLVEVEMLLNMTYELIEWFKVVLPSETVQFVSFFSTLKDGVILCRLAELLQRQPDSNITKPHDRSATRLLYKSHAICIKDRSGFHSRCNISSFLGWCRNNQMSQTVLFDTVDCYEATTMGRRQVVICLWYVARRFKQHGLPAPKLIEFEAQSAYSEQDTLTTYIHYKAQNKVAIDIYETLKKQVPDIDLEAYKTRITAEQEKCTRNSILVDVENKKETLTSLITQPPNNEFEESKTKKTLITSPTNTSASAETKGSDLIPLSNPNHAERTRPPKINPSTELVSQERRRRIDEAARRRQDALSDDEDPRKNHSNFLNSYEKGFLYIRNRKYNIMLSPKNNVFVRIGGGIELLKEFLAYKLRIYKTSGIDTRNLKITFKSDIISQERLAILASLASKIVEELSTL